MSENYLIKSINHLVDRTETSFADKKFVFHLFKLLMFLFLHTMLDSF